MNELDLATRLQQAVADEPPVQLNLHTVVTAGRRRRRANRTAGAAGVLALAVAAAVTAPALLDRNGPSDRITVAGPSNDGPVSQAPKLEEDPLTGSDLSAVSTAQAAEIADRIASLAEYRAAYGRYRACMSAGGYKMEAMPPVLSRGVHDFSIPAAAVDSGLDGKCYDREYKFTDILWQTSPAIQAQSEGTESLRKCLKDRGIEPRESGAELADQVRAAGIDLGKCLLPD